MQKFQPLFCPTPIKVFDTQYFNTASVQLHSTNESVPNLITNNRKRGVPEALDTPVPWKTTFKGVSVMSYHEDHKKAAFSFPLSLLRRSDQLLCAKQRDVHVGVDADVGSVSPPPDSFRNDFQYLLICQRGLWFFFSSVLFLFY